MILISHRGNITGKNKNENHPDHINKAISMGFDVEIDVWHDGERFFLGHDKPLYKIKKNFLLNRKLWCQAKNPAAIFELSRMKVHFFWHQKDDYTLTSKGYIWVYPNKKFFKNSIIVIKKKIKKFPKNCFGVCSDYVGDFK